MMYQKKHFPQIYLNDQLDKFLNNGDVDKPAGFKPVE